MKSLVDRIVIRQGDLTEMDTDAIVNAANNDLILGGGVAGAIRRKGGEEIQRECEAIGSIPLGGKTSADALRHSTAHSLRIANDHGLKSTAFPAIGTGIARFPLQDCAEIMLREAAEHLKGETSLEMVYFVLFDEAAEEVFKRSWKRIQAEPGFNVAGA